jgi:hypothetical protein
LYNNKSPYLVVSIQIIDKSAVFFANIISECNKHSINPGDVIRVLLPFNESTSSGDQSDVNNDMEDASSAFDKELKDTYQPYAISLRSLIRMKMADKQDFELVCFD